MRIIGGQARGRIIRAPAGKQTRPTSDRVREAIFSTLEARWGSLQQLTVLDLYAGSGALGLEAISRGAARAVFVDQQPACRRCIEANATALELTGRQQTLCMNVAAALSLLRRQGALFHLVFVDPPYHDDPVQVLEAIAREPVLEQDAWLILEHSPTMNAPEKSGSLELTLAKRYGDTAVSYYGQR